MHLLRSFIWASRLRFVFLKHHIKLWQENEFVVLFVASYFADEWLISLILHLDETNFQLYIASLGWKKSKIKNFLSSVYVHIHQFLKDIKRGIKVYNVFEKKLVFFWLFLFYFNGRRYFQKTRIRKDMLIKNRRTLSAYGCAFMHRPRS